MYWYYLHHIILLSVILNFPHISCEPANCMISYYADEISYKDASSLDFYYTSVGIKSVNECANFCFYRQFCRTAVYNYYANTCSVSYNWVINCWSHVKRYSEYQSKTQQLVRIACIDRCKIDTTETKTGNDLHQMKDMHQKLGVEITRITERSVEDKKGSATISQTNNATKSIRLETTTAVYKVLLAAATTITTTIMTKTTTTTITTTAAIPTTTTILTSIANAGTITTSEGNNSLNSVIDTTSTTSTTTTSNTATILIEGIKLPTGTMLKPVENEALLWWINLQKILGRDMPTYHTVIETDNRNETSNPQILISNIDSESKIRFLEEILNELRQKPDKYKVSVERSDDRRNWIVIHTDSCHKCENLQEAIFTDIPRMPNQFPRKHDSPEELKANYHVLRIKIPYEFLNNRTLSGREVERNEPNIGLHNTSGINRQRVNKQEEKLTFEKLPEKYIDKQHGYLYRVKIHGVNRDLPFTSDHEVRQREIGSSKIETTKTRDDNNSGKKTSRAMNPYCFGIIHRQLLYNASYKTLYDVSLERCRCACASTWYNDDKEDCMMKCRSFQYSNATRKCLLNEEDHNGNFDLVYSWDTDYFYRMCTGEDIAKDAEVNCPTNGKAKFEQFASKETFANEGTITSKAEDSETIHSNRKRSTVDHRSAIPSSTFRTQSVYRWTNSGKEEVSKKGIAEEVILSSGLWSNILKRKSNAEHLRSLVLKKQSEEMSVGKTGYDYKIEIRHGTTTTPVGHRGMRSTRDADLKTMEKSFAATTVSADYTDTPTIKQSSSPDEETEKPEAEVIETNDSGLNSSIAKFKTNMIDQRTTGDNDLEFHEDKGFDGTLDNHSMNYSLNENDITTVAVVVTKESDELTTSDEFETSEANGNNVSKTEQNSTSKTMGDCFEVIDGFTLKGTAGGLKQEVTVEECKCYCANSRIFRSNENYSFQCVSATYYHRERDCILNLQTKNEFPEQFQRQDNVSYLEMICSVEDSKQQLVKNDLIDGCHRTVDSSLATKKTAKIFTPVNTDSCFAEIPNHVLHGTAFSAETNVPVEACKCYCMSAETRYGTVCRSIEYYFDSRTCLLSNISRTTNPKDFNQSTAYTLTHSYFDKNCSIQTNQFSIYMKEKCFSALGSAPMDKNQIDNSGNSGTHADKTKNIHESGNDIDLIAGSTMTTMNPINSIHHSSTHPSTYRGLSDEIGEEKKEGKKLREVDDLKHLNLTTIYATTTISTSDFTTSAHSFTESRDTSVIPVMTTPSRMDYTVSDQTTMTRSETVKSTTYSHLGKCAYSAIYQTNFRGNKRIRKFPVSSAQDCFRACYLEGCRSTNLLQIDNQENFCELFRDALIDYRTADVLVYDRGSVYFDGIICTMKHRKEDENSSNENDLNNIDNEDYADD